MATHEILVPILHPDGSIQRAGAEIDYDGEPNWKLAPLDPKARTAWERTIADPERVDRELSRVPLTQRFHDGSRAQAEYMAELRAAAYL